MVFIFAQIVISIEERGKNTREDFKEKASGR
jgi:hypothetical protein